MIDVWNYGIGVTVGFDQTMYNISESTLVVPVCLRIVDGSLAASEDVTVMLESINGKATGAQEQMVMYIENNHLLFSYSSE